MNTSTKCNCCVCEEVCLYKELYENAVSTILDSLIDDGKHGFWKLRDCSHVEVSIRCPHMVTRSHI